MPSLNPHLPSLPNPIIPRPTSIAEWHKRLDERHTAALEVADNTLDAAQQLANYGDYAAAESLIAEARTYFDEAQTIASMRLPR
ncbi:hypothetical protein [Nocardia acidivorans]|uniref:hypothetical protein n=1 Tax=Nocardia acidivorans TaxID=404580 RepID=UPI000A4C83ED|nr:hypothetical protein [Nocardia acidivorans]